MGREIIKVPANWDHPVTVDAYGRDNLQPMCSSSYREAAAEWLADFDRIRNGGAVGYEIEFYPLGAVQWASDNTAPDNEDYRPWADEEAVWFQVWETVSEGTPVSPPFETEDELVKYLAENGDFWDQSGWGEVRAERFVKGAGWAPSFVAVNGVVKGGVAAVTDT